MKPCVTGTLLPSKGQVLHRDSWRPPISLVSMDCRRTSHRPPNGGAEQHSLVIQERQLSSERSMKRGMAFLKTSMRP